MTNAYADIATLKSSGALNYPAAVTDRDAWLRGLLEDASRTIDLETKRFFYCYEGTRYYNGAGSNLLIPDDILSITTLKTDTDLDGVFENTFTANTDYELFPLNEFPKLWLEISSRGARSFCSFAVNNPVKGVQIVGVFGHGNGISATPYHDSGAVVNTGGITSAILTHSLASGKGALFSAGMTIRIGSEQLYILSVTGDELTFLGNPLRGQNGTTAAAHNAGDVIYIYEYPAPIVQACIIMAMQSTKSPEQLGGDIMGNSITGQWTSKKGIPYEAWKKISYYIKTVV